MHQSAQSAQARWQSIILDDAEFVPNDPNRDLTGGRFLPGYGPYNGSVDDILIFYRLTDTLPENVLGSAGPTWIRVVNFQPYAGTMEFNSTSFAQGLITEDVILHEIAHVLGIGTVSAGDKRKHRLKLVSFLPPITMIYIGRT